MKMPSSKAIAPRSLPRASPGRVVPAACLHLLIRDYQDRRARLEARQTDPHASSLFRRTLRLQASTLTMVINDLGELAAGRAGRAGRLGRG